MMKTVNNYSMYLTLIFVVCMAQFSVTAQTVVADNSAENPHNPRLYSYIYWENGFPAVTARRPAAWHNLDFQTNPAPDIVIQTGYYNLRFDADDVELTGYDASIGSDYLSALHEDVTTFTAVDWQTLRTTLFIKAT